MTAGLYVHVPFCARRCGYCDFYSEVGQDDLAGGTVEAILREGALRGVAWRGTAFDSVFVGGGTPSFLGGRLLGRLLGGLKEVLPIRDAAEWTLEANPESADEETLASAIRSGVNRLSLGIQSFDDQDLELLGRIHDSRRAVEAFHRARAAGFRNLSLDLIYGLPSSTAPRSWERTLRKGISLEPEHVSCYLLDLEPHVPLGRRHAAGEIELPGEELARDEYELARRLLGEAGYEHYEISNWAIPARRCVHNQSTWEGGAYLGLGPGAHGHQDGCRRANLPDLAGYVRALERGEDPPHEIQSIDVGMRRDETILLGLRMRDGIAWDRMRAEFGLAWTQEIRRRAARWTGKGLLEDDGVRLRLGDEGLFVSNALMAELLGNG
jgi:oxygen-independent coproporphyrinogen III oxidase